MPTEVPVCTREEKWLVFDDALLCKSPGIFSALSESRIGRWTLFVYTIAFPSDASLGVLLEGEYK
jgi:hypothetical protein